MRYFYLPKPLSLPALVEPEHGETIPRNELNKIHLTDEEQKLYDGLSELIYRILSRIGILFHSPDTKEKSVIKKGAFTRKDRLSFPDLLTFISANLVGTLNDELAEFYQEVSYPKSISSNDSTLKDKMIMSEQEISKIRNEINDYPFRRAFEIARDEYLKFKKDFGVEFSDYAVDGSVLALPNLPVMAEFFGTSNDSPSARISAITDCETSFIIDGLLAPLRYQERPLFEFQFNQLLENPYFEAPKSNFIFDRGYPSHHLMKLISDENSYFLFRTPKNTFGSLTPDKIADFRKRLVNDVDVRVIKLKLSTDESESLVTNLNRVPFNTFHGLYHLRWRAEVAYFFLKHKVRLGDFNGNTPNSIYQSFWTCLTFYNITILVKMAADIIITSQRRGKNNKFMYEANLSEIVSETHIDIIKALTIDRTEEELKERIQNMITRASHYVIPIDKAEFSSEKRKRFARKAHYSAHMKVH